MKKIIITLLLACLTVFAFTLYAQVDTAETNGEETEAVEMDTAMEETPVEEPAVEELEVEAVATIIEEDPVEQPKGLHQVLKTKFIEGDPLWMTPVLLCLIIGLGLCIERIITISLSVTNTKKLLSARI